LASQVDGVVHDLHGQLACRAQHEAVRLSRLEVARMDGEGALGGLLALGLQAFALELVQAVALNGVRVQALEHGQQERGGFAAAGLA
jgi:hypothetical protein